MKKVKLNLGCGITLVKGFINIDAAYDFEELIENKDGYFDGALIEEGAEYLRADIRELPFPDNYADYAESIDVIEHIPFADVIATLKEIHRVLKPGAELLLTTPNVDGVFLEWIKMSQKPRFDFKEYQSMAQVVYGNQTQSLETHLTPFNKKFMNYCLGEAGFDHWNIYLYPPHTSTYDQHRVAETHQPFWEKIKKQNLESFTRNDYIFVEAYK